MTGYGPWEATPRWLTWLGYHEKRRKRFASWMIGGGFDGWEYFDDRPSALGETVDATGGENG